ncbi:hypothetical protein [Hymenobacter jeollabukensis]|uniref:Uncharacterized protein n=1 Tax=Hymenobacter jeollabukensis TaxID=2025313 RepID=A0A5R8WUE5_9BACT|nr:hypothetical protein [Hymenobacter jeollabukensis]TLM95035.1 hypothetical protein FDY95_04335 [Hymenobacter jeollabukensis]
MSKSYLLLAGALLATSGAFAQSVGIGTGAPATTAMLEVASTTKGMLVPRMTSAQRTAISSPAQGLLVYQTDGTAGFYYNNSTTSTANWLWLPDKVSAGDNLGNGTATSAVKLAGNSLSNNGTGGLSIDNSGNVTTTGNSLVSGNSSVAGNSAVTGNGSVSGVLAVGTTTADAKAALDITSTTKGLLPPRLTLTQRNAMGTPTVGMLIIQTDNTPGLYQYTSTGWASVGAGEYTAESSSAGNAPTTNVTVNPPATNIVYNDNGGANGTITLGTGTAGQRLVIVNNDNQYITVVSASGTGNILPKYAARFIYTGGVWRRES